MIESIAPLAILLVSILCLSFICIIMSKQLRRMEDEIVSLYTITRINRLRLDTIYLLMLERVKKEALRLKDDETAKVIQKIINDVLENSITVRPQNRITP